MCAVWLKLVFMWVWAGGIDIWILHPPDFKTGFPPSYTGMPLFWVLHLSFVCGNLTIDVWYMVCLVIIFLKIKGDLPNSIGIEKKKSFLLPEWVLLNLKASKIPEWTFCRFNSMNIYWAIGMCQGLCWCWSYKNEQFRLVPCSEGAHCRKQTCEWKSKLNCKWSLCVLVCVKLWN